MPPLMSVGVTQSPSLLSPVKIIVKRSKQSRLEGYRCEEQKQQYSTLNRLSNQSEMLKLHEFGLQIVKD